MLYRKVGVLASENEIAGFEKITLKRGTSSGVISAGHEGDDLTAASGDRDKDCTQDRCHADGPNRGFESVEAADPK